jgi:DNA polymerase III subunit delta'
MWEVVGHDRAVENLRYAISSGRLPHALLFCGQVGVGKTRLALELAKALNCTGAEPPCQQCVHCRQIESGGHPDVTVAEPLEGKDSISIAQVRELRDGAALRPFQASFKVIIIAGAESLTPQAADALLKTLEEPQRQVRIVLTATEPEALPSTVVSRCRVINLLPATPEVIEQALVARGESAEQAAVVSQLARGSVGWAIEASRHPKVIAERAEIIDRMSTVFELDLASRIDLAERMTSERRDRSWVRRNLQLLVYLTRDLLLIQTGLQPALAQGVGRANLERAAARYSLPQVEESLEAMRLVMDRVDSNVDPRLALEAMLISLP